MSQLETTRKAYGNGVARDGDMDDKQLFDLLMRLNQDNATQTERQRAMDKKLDELLQFKEQAVTSLNASIEQLHRRDSEFERRINDLEGKGFFSWSAKRVAQLAALIGAGGVILAAAWESVKWLLAHWR